MGERNAITYSPDTHVLYVSVRGLTLAGKFLAPGTKLPEEHYAAKALRTWLAEKRVIAFPRRGVDPEPAPAKRGRR